MHKTSLYNILFGFAILIAATTHSNACYLSPPVADIDFETWGVNVGETVTLYGSGSYDPDGGNIVDYIWSFPDEAVWIQGQGTPNFNCKFRSGTGGASYRIYLEVKDDEGYYDSAYIDITVSGSCNDWYVSSYNGDDYNDGPAVSPFSSIQTAIECADADPLVHSEIKVELGTYYGNIDFGGKNITIKSCDFSGNDLGDWADIEQTVIHGVNAGPVVTFAGNEPATATLENLTITGGGVPDVPVGHWKFDDMSWNMTVDDSGKGYDGLILGGPSWDNGKVGRVLNFDGVDDYVVIAGYKGVAGTSSRTVCAWIKTTSTGDIVTWGNNTPHQTIVVASLQETL